MLSKSTGPSPKKPKTNFSKLGLWASRPTLIIISGWVNQLRGLPNILAKIKQGKWKTHTHQSKHTHVRVR